jgi:hypothetical protein
MIACKDSDHLFLADQLVDYFGATWGTKINPRIQA